MSEYVEVGTAIIAGKIKIDAIKINLGKRTRVINGKLFYPFAIERGGIVEILSPLEVPEVPWAFSNEKVLYSEKGDKLNAKRLWGCSDRLQNDRQKQKGTSEVRSGDHSRQSMEIRGNYCYAVIISSWRGENINILPSDYERRKLTDGEL